MGALHRRAEPDRPLEPTARSISCFAPCSLPPPSRLLPRHQDVARSAPPKPRARRSPQGQDHRQDPDLPVLRPQSEARASEKENGKPFFTSLLPPLPAKGVGPPPALREWLWRSGRPAVGKSLGHPPSRPRIAVPDPPGTGDPGVLPQHVPHSSLLPAPQPSLARPQPAWPPPRPPRLRLHLTPRPAAPYPPTHLPCPSLSTRGLQGGPAPGRPRGPSRVLRRALRRLTRPSQGQALCATATRGAGCLSCGPGFT